MGENRQWRRKRTMNMRRKEIGRGEEEEEEE